MYRSSVIVRTIVACALLLSAAAASPRATDFDVYCQPSDGAYGWVNASELDPSQLEELPPPVAYKTYRTQLVHRRIYVNGAC